MGKWPLPAFLSEFLAEPLLFGRHVDQAETAELARKVIEKKEFLNRIYQEWYQRVALDLPSGPEPVLELGTGGGFGKRHIPGLLTSEFLRISGVDLYLDACGGLPFKDSSLRGIVLIDVLHHLPRARSFFAEARRCLIPGGVISMIEPWVTSWSEFIFRNFHHEPCLPDARDWDFPSSGPLTGANQALPKIIFHRDRHIFEREFPQLKVQSIEPFMPFRYLLSGGLTFRAFVPSAFFVFFRAIERLFRSARNHFAMFAHLVVKKEMGILHE